MHRPHLRTGRTCAAPLAGKPSHSPCHPAAPPPREVVSSLNQNGIDSQFCKSLPGALRSLAACPWRVASADLLMKLKGFGAHTAGVRRPEFPKP